MNHKRTSVADAVGCYRNVRLHHQPPGGKESHWLPWTDVTIKIYNKKKNILKVIKLGYHNLESIIFSLQSATHFIPLMLIMITDY